MYIPEEVVGVFMGLFVILAAIAITSLKMLHEKKGGE